MNENNRHKLETLTSLPKVIWEEGRVAAKVRPHWLQWRAPNLPPKLPLPARGLILKPHYLPHPWTRPTSDANGIRIRSAVFPQCTGQTDAPTDRPRISLTTMGRYASNESDAA